MNKIWYDNISNSTEEKIMKVMNLNKKSKLLDFGCGNGRYSKIFAKHTRKNNIVCVETCKSDIKKMIENGFLCLDSNEFNRLPFKDSTFDYIFSSNVLEHIEREKYLFYLSEFNRILKKKGRFVVGVPNYPFKRIYDIFKAFTTKKYKYYFFDDPTHINKLNYYRFEKDLKKTL